MTAFAVQYLEDASGIAPDDARAKLRAALEQLPIARVLLGWNVPDLLADVCRDETKRAGAQLFRWHLLLAGDGAFVPRPEWRTIGLQGEPAPGFENMPEFTFVCPNRPAVREAVWDHLRQTMKRGGYDGLFLDRIRFPSPAADPTRWLACFCDDCRRAASEVGLDLEPARKRIGRLLANPGRVRSCAQTLLGSRSESAEPDLALLEAFLDFRERSVSEFVRPAAALIHAEGLAVGLDCFSPSLARMVGQDLSALDACADWIKVMTYGHTLGPAGLPFELLALAGWLIEKQSLGETQVLGWLSQASGLPLPLTRADLRARGLPPAALFAEIKRARAARVRTLLAGIELVEIEGITHLEPAQIEADVRAFREAGADGLVLSWDLRHIPIERLQRVGAIWIV